MIYGGKAPAGSDSAALTALMNQADEARASESADGSESCGCCEIGDFAPTSDPDTEPWCSNCDHSPEEHE